MKAAKRYSVFARTLCMALVLASAACAAHAQGEPAPSKFSLKAGGFFPTQGTLRSQSGSPYWVIGGEFHPNFKYALAGGHISLGAELMYRESGSVRFLTVPITAQVTWNITPPGSSVRVYGGLGGGAYFINTEGRGETIQPGAKFIVGADITQHLFLEANYHYVGGFTDDNGAGIHNDGISLLFGYRY